MTYSFLLISPLLGDKHSKNLLCFVIRDISWCLSRYLDDLLINDGPYFEQLVNQIYPTELLVK